MIRIDGSERSGSGTIVRFAVALAAARGEALHVVKARARRPRPGLRPQHLAAVRAAAALCGAETEGLAVGASEFVLRPAGAIRGGVHAVDIGTAGSATMLALGVLPLACLADGPVALSIAGGVFQDFAPSPHHLEHVLVPLLARMGAAVELRVLRAGYLPRGAGRVELRVRPAAPELRALALDEPGNVRTLEGVAFASHLAERRVCERMAAACEARCAERRLPAPRIERVEDETALHPGASLALWATTSTGARLGADRAGAPRRSSEAIGRFVADALADDLASGATADRHLADQLVPFAALAAGATRFRAARATEHLETNLWLAERFGARVARSGSRVEVVGLGVPAGGAARARVVG
jgi:RNA 3'-terminal phosphate cyclase (ATP)